jgi:hypothetical protein
MLLLNTKLLTYHMKKRPAPGRYKRKLQIGGMLPQTSRSDNALATHKIPHSDKIGCA